MLDKTPPLDLRDGAQLLDRLASDCQKEGHYALADRMHDLLKENYAAFRYTPSAAHSRQSTYTRHHSRKNSGTGSAAQATETNLADMAERITESLSKSRTLIRRIDTKGSNKNHQAFGVGNRKSFGRQDSDQSFRIGPPSRSASATREHWDHGTRTPPCGLLSGGGGGLMGMTDYSSHGPGADNHRLFDQAPMMGSGGMMMPPPPETLR
eukprot:GHVU01028373.1.p1 GENE.GHVU01028373.1~~GHVU01028373.1.p1  ORF type:complete len:209 (-),score=28.96 GHVU01028373.1:94-720(-)